MTKHQLYPETVERITPADASRITGLTTGHLARMADQGKLTCARPGGTHRRYLLSEVEALAKPLAPADRRAPAPP